MKAKKSARKAKPATFSQLPRRVLEVDGQAVHVAEALGSCGFSTQSKVEVAHLHGVSLFVFETTPRKGPPFYNCVVTGMMSCGAASRDEALAEGVRRARSAVRSDIDRHLSIAKLQELALTPRVEEVCHGPV